MTETMTAPNPSAQPFDPVVEPEECTCYKCSEPVYYYDGHTKRTFNNVHGELTPCDDCGRLKSEWFDLGTKGYYKCWWCERRAEPLK